MFKELTNRSHKKNLSTIQRILLDIRNSYSFQCVCLSVFLQQQRPHRSSPNSYVFPCVCGHIYRYMYLLFYAKSLHILAKLIFFAVCVCVCVCVFARIYICMGWLRLVGSVK